MGMRLVAVAVVFASSLIAQQYTFVRVPGSPLNVRAAVQDRAGRLWVTTSNNLFIFDGSRFYSLQEHGHPVSGVLGLLGGEDGAIWAASPDGVFRCTSANCERVIEGFATSVVSLGHGVMIASLGPPGGAISEPEFLVRLARNRNAWKVERLIPLSFQGGVTLDRHRSEVLFACPNGWCDVSAKGLLDWSPGRKIEVGKHAFPGWSFGKLRAMRDRYGCVWMNDEASVKYQCKENGTPVSLPIRSYFWSVEEMNDGSMLIVSAQQLMLGRPGAFRIVGPNNRLGLVEGAVQTKDGSIWLLTAQGIIRWAFAFELEFWADGQGIKDVVWSSVRVKDEMLTAVGPSIVRLSSNRDQWTPLATTKGLGRIQHLLEGPGGTIYAAFYENGVGQFNRRGDLLARPAPGQVLAMMLARTPDGQLWLSGAGINRIERAGQELIAKPEPLPGDQTHALDMEVDMAGRLWGCYASGLAVRDGGVWHRFTTADGLLENACRSMAIEKDGTVWYGYHDLRAFSRIRFAGSHLDIKHFREGGDIGTAMCYLFDQDRRGWLWRSNDEALYIASPEQADAGQWISLSILDGLPATPNQQSLYEDRDGSIWFGADRNLVHFTPPPDFVHPQTPPSVFISGFSINGKAPELAETVGEIPHGSNVVAYVGSLQFDRRSALRIRYRVLPDDQRWRDERSLDLGLGNLATGTHTLEVQARIGTGPYSAVLRRSVEVAKSVWFTWPVLLAIALGSSAISAGGYAWLKARNAEPGNVLGDISDLRMEALLPSPRQLTGKTLDSRYRVGSVIARGGFATVFEGIDQETSNRCAIKIFRREIAEQEHFTQGFHREVEVLEQIRHPHIVEIFGHGFTPSGLPYLAMEFVEGETLRQSFSKGPLPRPLVAELLSQLGQALGALHEHGIYHRDVKPENILLRAKDHQAVLIDFSIALVQDPLQTLHGLTRAGTIEYMAPEHTLGYADASTDIYSLAKVLVEMLYGSKVSALVPKPLLSFPAQLSKVLRSTDPELSESAINLISSALDYSPVLRPRDIVSFSRAVAQELRSRPLD